MNILVVYDSRTHNTKTIAQAIADELSQLSSQQSAISDVRIFELSALSDEELTDEMNRADLIILGSWNKRSTFSPPVLKRIGTVLKTSPILGSNKRWAYILTSGAVAPPYVKVCKSNLKAAFPQVTSVLGIFICQGKMGEHVLRKYESGKGHQNDTPEMLKMRIANWHEALSHPNALDIQAAQSWARDVLAAASA